MKVAVVGLGAGGHARVIMELLMLEKRFRLVGLLDPDPALHGHAVGGIEVLGDDSLLPVLKEQGVTHFFVGVGSTSSLALRRRLYEFAHRCGLTPVSAIHPTAMISPSAILGKGVTVMATAVVGTGAGLGENVIINTGAIIEHDCKIGDHVHVATGATLAGGVVVGEETHIGAAAVVRQQIHVGTRALIGAGAVVVKDVVDGSTVLGNPARPRG